MTNKSLSFFEAVAVLVGSTIGAGILGIPFAVAKVGWLIGVIYLVCLGALLMGLNLMLGEIVARTKQPLQIPGLAAKYLGGRGKTFVTVTTLFGSYGALLAYIIGEGYVLQALFGGNAFGWSLLFWAVAAAAVFFGLRLIKKLDMLLTLIIFVCLIVIVFWSAPSVRLPNLFGEISWLNLFLPYGVILFALQGAMAIPQVEDVLPNDQPRLKEAIVVGSLIPAVVYFIYMTAVIGVTGSLTTEVASIGLGQKLGSGVLIFGNVFAFFTMGTAFLNSAIAIKRQFEWDYKKSRFVAWFLTVSVPVILFLIGVRNFIQTIDIVGSVFGSISAIVIILIYWRAKQKGDLPATQYKLHHTLLLSILIIIIFLVGAFLTIFDIVK
ncbi:MAG: aromatic amino acid transport family protein [Patescibacteria group bacterium]